MSYTLVQTTNDGTGQSGSVTSVALTAFGASPGTSNLIIVPMSYTSASVLATSVTDTVNTYTQIGTGVVDTYNNTVSQLFYAWDIAGGVGVKTITLHSPTAVTDLSGTASEYSGIKSTGDPLAGFIIGSPQLSPANTSNAITSGNGTPTGQPALAYAVTHNCAALGVATSAGTGFGNLITHAETNLSNSWSQEDQSISSTAPIAGTFTSTSASGGSWSTMIAFFLLPSVPVVTVAWLT